MKRSAISTPAVRNRSITWNELGHHREIPSDLRPGTSQAGARLRQWPVKVLSGGDRACYSPALDRIRLDR